MSDFNQLEMRRETLFKDAVLSLAEARGMEIIAEAGKKRAEELELAYKTAEGADYATVKEAYYRESDKAFMAVASQVRQELLAFRQGLVQGLFVEIEARLLAFSSSAGYPGWLAEKLRLHADIQEKNRPITLFLRAEDMPHTKALLAVLPAAVVKEDAGIRLGGLKVEDGRILYDETIDEMLRAEQDRFYESGQMQLQVVQDLANGPDGQ